ncbi:MAG TPA: cytochrome P450 [Anaerolinea thermolimosa]|uniref:Cytochrome P450 n=1 Tax=Anaerolinea thermolimosa TaxID=229919 RepID=A0A3D1JFK7_9CHLR|nr:cytochrome P450 [Anaerolinea thermolimosa]GAP07266.1 cytochrome P450 [Anaerolinea thermolimosa]HCE17234.1 cytochrome P450 [Anaerolinea thermolimosa]
MSKTFPPGPTSQELLRRIPSIQSDTLTFLTDISQRFGRVVGFHIAGLPIIVINHPEGIKHVLLDEHRRYSKDTLQYRALSTVTGRGLLTNDGESWLQQRRLAQPAFSRQRLAHLDDIVIPATEAMLEGWEPLAQSGQPVDIDAAMMHLTLQIVGKALFSIDLSRDAVNLTRATLTALDTIIYRARNVFTPPAFIPTLRNLKFRRALKTLNHAVAEMVSSRRNAGQPGDDLLGMFLRARDEDTGASMSDQQVRDEIMTMLIAGHETVASALTWTWYLLSRHPEESIRARDEINRVLGKRPPTVSDLEHLPGVGRIFSEALRLYPPAWVISRKALEEDEVLGFNIPRNALVVISPYVVHRQAEFWPEPEQFHPERFLSGPPHRFAYLPFGAGPRLCIGYQFATLEAQLIITRVLQQYTLEWAHPQAVRMDALVTLRPHGGLPMHLRKI